MPRIILVAGKGGVGKTTVAAATAVAAAKRGHRVLVLSFDLAHSLSDSFDLDRSLFDLEKGLPVTVTRNLDVQEIDVQDEIDRHWGDIYKYIAMLFSSANVTDTVAEEVAILPGLEDVIALMHINRYIHESRYDAIIVDCPPTSESLRFVNITATVEWYMMKRFNIDRALFRIAAPIVNRVTDYQMPDDAYFRALQRIFQQLDGVQQLLVDPSCTTVRLVTAPEKMIIRETQRAYMYFNLYGVMIDSIILNRVLPPSEDAFLSSWVKTQAAYVKDVHEYFVPIPVVTVPLFPHEVVGLPRLGKLAKALFKTGDPIAFNVQSSPYQFSKQADDYELKMKLPFADKADVDLHRKGSDLIIRVGTFKRHVPLPRAAARRAISSARFEGDELSVRFREELT